MKNKKLLIIVAAVVVVLAVVLAVVLLGGNKTPAGPTEKEYKLGMGVQFGELSNAQINATDIQAWYGRSCRRSQCFSV